MMGRTRPHHGVAIMTRRRRGAAEWAALIDEWKRSGLNLPEFCRRRGLSRGTMQNWVYKPTHRRAIEAARRDGQVPEAKAAPEDTRDDPAPASASLPVRFAEATARPQP